MKQSIFENKVVLYITFIPYVVILLVALYSGIVGFQWMDTWCVGLDGFISSLVLIGMVLVATPIGIPFFLCVIYQILYVIHWRKRKKLN